jgi:hypothetical protein
MEKTLGAILVLALMATALRAGEESAADPRALPGAAVSDPDRRSARPLRTDRRRESGRSAGVAMAPRTSLLRLWTEPAWKLPARRSWDATLQADRPSVSRLFVGRPVGCAPDRFLSMRPACDAPDEEAEESCERLLGTLKTVAPTLEDRLLLLWLLERDRLRPAAPEQAPTRRMGPAPEEPAPPPCPVWQPGAFLELEPDPRLPPEPPDRAIRRLARQFADELVEEEEKCFRPIGLEARIYGIHARRDRPTDIEAYRDSQAFIDGYLRRRAPRAVYTALLSTSRNVPAVERAYEELIKLRDRYFALTYTYGSFDRETLSEKADESVAELADRRLERTSAAQETIEEELERRRLPVSSPGFHPFRKGRFSVRANPVGFGQWLMVSWKTPNIHLKAGESKARLQLAGRIGGLEVASYATARYHGLRGRSGFELARQFDRFTRLRLVAGVNFGQGAGRQEDLVDFFAITGDRSFLYLAWEKVF